MHISKKRREERSRKGGEDRGRRERKEETHESKKGGKERSRRGRKKDE